MSTPTSRGEVPVHRIDRILAYMSFGLLLLSIVCFLAIMIGSANGADMREGVWPTVGALVWFTPPVAFVLVITLVILNFARRARANRAE
ncbi:multidrug ABC transporter ATPase [Microbacterium sp. zg.Y625]|uniref:multidrug ABC transporter ATPase n=1 Tax=Microbacterium jiangjiandongii TaxID=3049071 RepID=UPI00214BAA95|nr:MULTISPECIES: multidrug ABC transporter ATPase [unclassified Microbacterium]MCR2791723.1 multidrug ABC transporter ATPase [Microbacterium sp. zg.Y625]MCR2816564.1 multidrug ABC transporter ATPase [Microbacterium sp. zg.Y843]WIM24541.1 multidrug ABC transporter ATPase [Microbacterium sp. zg-Y625]